MRYMYVAIDSSGGIWIATGDGLSYLYDNRTPHDKADDTWYLFYEADGLVNDECEGGILMDSGGLLWIMTFGGFCCFDCGGTPENKLDDDWIGFDMNLYDGSNIERLSCAAVDQEGGMWIGSEIGVHYFDDNGTPFNAADDSWYHYPEDEETLDNGYVHDIHIDSSGGIWIGTEDNLYYLDNGGSPLDAGDDVWIEYTEDDGLPDNEVQVIIAAPEGGLWIGTNWGLCHFDDNGTPTVKSDDGWNVFKKDTDGMVNNNVTGLAIDGSGRLWIGIRGGVSCLDYGDTPSVKSDDVWINFTTASGLSNNIVRSIAVDPDEGVWIGTYNGLSYYGAP
ncbi:MAG: hypothetical protein JXQ30_14930 [Spirochaetes bacterium]|nr:hypothetical protein [Spirochaetota bacterium]